MGPWMTSMHAILTVDELLDFPAQMQKSASSLQPVLQKTLYFFPNFGLVLFQDFNVVSNNLS